MNPVQPGQPITAALFNQLIEEAGRSLSIRGGAGVDVSFSERAVIISLARAFREYLVFSVITASYGALPDDVRANVKYDAVGIGRPEAKVLARVPDIGIGEDVRIIRAPVGSPCIIVRVPKDDGSTTDHLWVFEGAVGEKRAVATCSTTGQGGGGGGEDDEPAGGEGEETSGTGSRTIDAPAVVDQERRKLVRMLAQEVAVELVEMGIVRR